MSADEHLRFLRMLAQRHPTPSPTIGVNLTWEEEGRELSIFASGDLIRVHFMAGSREVESFAEATDLVAAIFADEVVSVTGFCKGDPVYYDLARTGDLAGGIAKLDRSRGSAEIPMIDRFQAQSWTGAHDFDSEV